METAVPFDKIFLRLPDGREVLGSALIICNSFKYEGGGGHIKQEFDLDPRLTGPRELCVMLVELEKPIRPRIEIGRLN